MAHRPLDLNSLPPELRRVIEQQLSKLPPAAREKLLREGSPLVEKMIAKLQGGGPPPLPGASAQRAKEAVQRAAHGASAAAERAGDAAHRITRIVPHGHYNATVRPGDGANGGFWAVVLIAAAVLVAFFAR